MAKQYGIHQIKGKVGNMSYYRSSGVNDSLIRSINQGLSSRVKNGDEYANTRLNNQDFKHANRIATFLFNAVLGRKKAMARRFAIANMTKRAYEYEKLGSGRWGQRVPVTPFDQVAVDILDNFAKGGSYQGEYGDVTVAFDRVEDQKVAVIDLVGNATVPVYLDSIGASGFKLMLAAVAMASIPGVHEMREHYFAAILDTQTVDSASSATTTSFDPFVLSDNSSFPLMTVDEFNIMEAIGNQGAAAILTIVPFKQIMVQDTPVQYDLWENATFVPVSCGQLGAE